MFHEVNRSAVADLHARSDPRGREYFSLSEIISFLWHNCWVIAISLFVGIALSVAYILVTEPLFTARAHLLIDPKSPQLPREQIGTLTYSLDTAQLESQMAVLRSRAVATFVIDRLGLESDPEFYAPSSLLGRLFGFRGDDTSTLSDSERSGRTKRSVESRLDVRRSGMSYAVEISFTSRDPDKAARIANAIAEAYVHDQQEAKSQAARLGSNWLETRIRELRQQMNAATHRLQEFKLKHDYRIAPRSVDAADADSSARGHTLEELETNAEAYRRMYESFLQAFATAADRQSYPASYARVITPAIRPSGKSHPHKGLVLAFGALVGLLGGLGISLLRSNLDDTVRSSRQVADQLGLECLGEIPRLRQTGIGALLPFTSGANGAHLDQITRTPVSLFTSSLQAVRASIKLAQGGRQIRCIGITSALPGEGKSTVASNLATLFALSGSRTLLIDADLYTSKLSRELAPKSTDGLIQAIRNPSRAKRQIVSPNGARFDLLPMASETIVNSSDILGSDAMRLLLEKLSVTYDHIIFDLPPLKPVADGLAISPLLDGVIVVVEWGETPVEALAEIARALRKAKAFVLGIVMTKVYSGPGSTYGRYYGYGVS